MSDTLPSFLEAPTPPSAYTAPPPLFMPRALFFIMLVIFRVFLYNIGLHDFNMSAHGASPIYIQIIRHIILSWRTCTCVCIEQHVATICAQHTKVTIAHLFTHTLVQNSTSTPPPNMLRVRPPHGQGANSARTCLLAVLIGRTLRRAPATVCHAERLGPGWVA